MRLVLICIILSEALIFPACAHSGVGPGNSFSSGVAHPLNGADHLIAMTMVGLWSVFTGGRAVVVWPATFVAAMLGGFAAASSGLQMVFVEQAICLSVVLLGVFVVFGVRAPVALGAVIVGLFAFFHGHAHGTEAAAASRLIPYAAGFALATSALHAVGIVAGFCLRSTLGRLLLRAAGGCAAVVGLSLLGG
ncbi:HupE/UreJ family protein [Bradyrhizobium erythrophlei]|uniref:Urease accessory protein n=1 Tax=Bradyrhizobium erythrophlei TaxID=1437360 RepID=A0A1M5P2Q7_9BRAD|nr:HupE/UreJ family protein [Bradyrhizobium erythrophlei]SHG96091.1 urease accessory protein [Bradyrhizobium erythrophlei]